MPANSDALYAEAGRLWQMGQGDAALAALDAALRFRPGFVEALYNRGVIALAMHRFDAALADFDRAVQLRPNFEMAWNNRGGVLLTLGRFDEAVANFDRLIATAPRNGRAWYNRGTAWLLAGRHDKAATDFARALALMPDHPDAFGCLASTALHLCDFARTAELAPQVERHIQAGKDIIAGLVVLGYTGDPALQRRASENYLAATLPKVAPLPPRKPTRRNRIRIAYLSGDFHAHAIAFLTAELFEKHDRSRFELVGISYGMQDGGPQRARIARAFDRFHDVAGADDAAVASGLRALEIDIAVDLSGHTQGARTGILARRPAPVQVAYLGYPGTMGGGAIDYVIADSVVAPFTDAPFFSEKIVHLPGCYQVNDSQRPRPDAGPSRAELGLPEDAFVLLSFNKSWKIRGDVFAVWMRLLHAVPKSVLWLLADNDGAQRNLARAAEAAGIDPARLVFAPRVPLDQHLARHRAADLFLDTLPYNAHTTASDALWMGVPVVTVRGSSFAGRVATSLLAALGMEELVTDSHADYEALALALAQNPARLRALKDRLDATVPTAALFDAGRFAKGLERAYERMWERALAGAAPDAFAVSV